MVQGRFVVRRDLTLVLLTLAYLFSFIDRQILAILLEPIKAELELSDLQLGLLSGIAFALFYATLGIPIARFADHSNRRNIVAVSVAVWSLMTALCGVAQSFTHLLFARIGVGVGEAGGGPPSQSMIADLYLPGRRATAMAIYSVGSVLGGSLGVMIGGNVAHHYGWRAAMFAVGLPGVALALAIWLFAIEPTRGSTESTARTVIAAPESYTLWEGVTALVRDRAALVLVMAMALTSLVGYTVVGWAPSYMRRSLGLSMLDIANYIALPAGLIAAGSAVIGGMVADWIARQRGIHWQMWIITILKTIGWPFSLLFLLTDSVPVAVGAYFAAFLFGSIYIGPSFAMLQHLAPLRLRSLWASLMLLVSNLIGLGAGPLVVGYLSDLFRPHAGAESLRYAMIAVSCVTPVAIALYWWAGALISRRADAHVDQAQE